MAFSAMQFYRPTQQTNFPLLRPIPHLPFNNNKPTAGPRDRPEGHKPAADGGRTRPSSDSAVLPTGKASDQDRPLETRTTGAEEAKADLMAKDAEKATSGGAYKRRNVYKSIVRHMFSYIRKNRDGIIKILLAAGYPMNEIEHAFFEVSCYNDLEQQRGNKKQSQTTIRKMVDKPTIYTYILRETLNAMIKGWNEGKHGKVATKNLATYRDVCLAYYNEAVKTITPDVTAPAIHL